MTGAEWDEALEECEAISARRADTEPSPAPTEPVHDAPPIPLVAPPVFAVEHDELASGAVRTVQRWPDGSVRAVHVTASPAPPAGCFQDELEPECEP